VWASSSITAVAPALDAVWVLLCIPNKTRGADEAGDTPGGAMHSRLKRIKKQVEAVSDGERLSLVRHRSMLTPTLPALKLTPTFSIPPRPSTARPDTASTAATSRTPLSQLGSAAMQSDADYWHRRYGFRMSPTLDCQTPGLRLRTGSQPHALRLCHTDCQHAVAYPGSCTRQYAACLCRSKSPEQPEQPEQRGSIV
jgi:hypothetical protein